MTEDAADARPLVRFIRFEHAADLPAPSYESPLAAGADLRAAVDEDDIVTIAPGARALVPTGIAVALPAGWEAQVRPRSGLAAKRGITCLNSPGTIDADYRGEVHVLLHNTGIEAFTVTRGERIAQLVVARAPQAVFELCETLDDTERGAGGFGSTGVG
ncbi:MAG: dUTP diphosphatase [Pseudomonadota bacterium]